MHFLPPLISKSTQQSFQSNNYQLTPKCEINAKYFSFREKFSPDGFKSKSPILHSFQQNLTQKRTLVQPKSFNQKNFFNNPVNQNQIKTNDIKPNQQKKKQQDHQIINEQKNSNLINRKLNQNQILPHNFIKNFQKFLRNSDRSKDQELLNMFTFNNYKIRDWKKLINRRKQFMLNDCQSDITESSAAWDNDEINVYSLWQQIENNDENIKVYSQRQLIFENTEQTQQFFIIKRKKITKDQCDNNMSKIEQSKNAYNNMNPEDDMQMNFEFSELPKKRQPIKLRDLKIVRNQGAHIINRKKNQKLFANGCYN